MKLNLKKILKDRDISVNQLHKLTGISRTTLDPLSKSDNVPEKTRFDTLNRICESLDINMDELITFENDQLMNVVLDEFKIINTEKKSDTSYEITLRSKNNIFLYIEMSSFTEKLELSSQQQTFFFGNLIDFKGINSKNVLEIFLQSSYNEISIFFEYLFNQINWNINTSISSIEFLINLDFSFNLFTARTALYNFKTKKLNLARLNKDGSFTTAND